MLKQKGKRKTSGIKQFTAILPHFAVYLGKRLIFQDGPLHLHLVELFQEWHPEPKPTETKKINIMKRKDTSFN